MEQSSDSYHSDFYDRFKMKMEHQASYTQTRRIVCKPLANGSRTKFVYVWTGLQTCTALSVNGLHTVRRKSKSVGFLREHKEN